MDKVKELFAKHKWLWGVVAGAGALIAYFLFRGSGGGSYTASDVPTVSSGGGVTSGGEGTTSDQTSTITGLMSNMYDNFKNLITGVQEGQTASQTALVQTLSESQTALVQTLSESQTALSQNLTASLTGIQENTKASQTALAQVLTGSQADTRSLIEKLADKINGLVAPVAAPATNEPPSLVKQILSPAAQIWTAPVQKVVGGIDTDPTDIEYIIGNKETLDNWALGGSKSSGSGSADFSEWKPAGSSSPAVSTPAPSTPSTPSWAYGGGEMGQNSANWA